VNRTFIVFQLSRYVGSAYPGLNILGPRGSVDVYLKSRTVVDNYWLQWAPGYPGGG